MGEQNSHKHVFLFDRDRESISVVKDALAELGCSVDAVVNGFSGVVDVRNANEGIVIIDADFPGLSCFELLLGIRKDNHSIPIIVSGALNEEMIVNVFRSGATDFIKKPIDTTELKDRVAHLVNNGGMPTDVTLSEDVKEMLSTLERDKVNLSNLLKISSTFDITSDSKAILSRLTDLAATSMNCEASSILLINERESTLDFVVAVGDKKTRLDTLSIPINEGIAGWVAKHDEPQIVNDTSKDERFTGKVDNESGFVTRQILAVPLRLNNKIIGVLEAINTVDKRIFGEEDVSALTAIGDRAATFVETTKTIENHQNFFVQTSNILVNAIEKKDIYSEGHPWKVAELCYKIGLVLKLTETERNDLHVGALLHDIGKLTIPSILLNKQKLTERELDFIQQHPVKGAKLIEPINVWKSVVPFVLYHHEGWDGNGYPFGRSGETIPLGARIINLAEAFTVMRSSNTYKKQISLKEAILEIMRQSGKQFDPELVKVLITVLEKERNRQ